jgi:formimidoylglutamate deiminase
MNTADAAYHFEKALVGTSIESNVRIEVGADGTITSIETDAATVGTDRVPGIALPGMSNLHSHAFQRAMAGLTEHKAGSDEDFWSWRAAMYTMLAGLEPKDLEAIATILYMEMLKAGYTGVGEFHYLHHSPGGDPYDDPTLMSAAIIKAAQSTGIGLTHLPVLYMVSGFGREDVDEEQRRFANSFAGFGELFRAIAELVDAAQGVELGLAFHSLRAVPGPVITPALQMLQDVRPDAVVHMHVAEQRREVADCLNYAGAHPVEWLLANAPVNQRWCIIHATHMTDEEAIGLADSGATVGLCPTTEANLGDGIFGLERFLKAGGRFGIGSDSHCSVDPREELRLLEYSQRLITFERSIGADSVMPYTGANLWRRAAAGGAAALGRHAGSLEVGRMADIVVIDSEGPAVMGAEGLTAIDSIIFSGHDNPVRYVLVGGEWQVRGGEHVRQADILEQYRPRVENLRAELSRP